MDNRLGRDGANRAKHGASAGDPDRDGARGGGRDRPRDGGPAATPAPRRWVILVIGLVAMTAGCTFQYGLAYLIPALRQQGFTLELASTVVACPTIGLLLTLIAWGAAADRFGERRVLATGLGLAGFVLLMGASVHGAAGLGLCLAVGGAAGGSVFAASGRLILGWFARHERGLAMGIRQSAQPLGVALAAATLPALGGGGTAAPLLFLGGFCLVAAVLVAGLVRDPPRPGASAPAPTVGARLKWLAGVAGAGALIVRRSAHPREQHVAPEARRASPYRQPVLWRIHAASALLVVPQFTVATFALVFLVDARGWTALSAGRLLAVAQLGGAASRLGAGYWSDRVGSRMRPMRVLAGTTAVGMAALAAAAAVGTPAVVPILLACSIVAVSTNGLAFTAVAEYAGSAWAGRALGIQNTGQNALAAATPPVLALAIGSIGFGASFAVVAAFPVAAAVLVPVAAEARRAGDTRPAARQRGPREAAETAP
ncbi:MAG TPA: MFS transporter [Streptosporangiaceae bacterium]|nr:MFS transporter [Streptosporangiaceae bacterium]